MSLAEELLADLEDDDDEEDRGQDHDEVEDEFAVKSGETDQESLKEVTKIYGSEKFNSVISRIKKYSAENRTEVSGPVEADPEYLLIVEANNLAAEIDDEISEVYKWAKEKYSARFPELETLVVQPLEYLMAAKELRNNVLKAKNNAVLEQFLTQATIMVVSVTASTTQGVDIADDEMRKVVGGCDVALNLNESKQRILTYVESRMAFIAPNLSVIIGASTAAKLMGAAGGLTPLSKMPSNHVALLGQQKKTLSGFSQRSTLPHTGFIYYSDPVQEAPPDLRRKIGRIVGNKCTLAARVDAQHESTDGHIGQEFRDEIEKKLEKLQEPPPVKATKAMPAPIDAPQKKRGGRRVRKMKERYAITEKRKQMNRMNFGELEEDEYQEDLGFSRGNLGKGGAAGGGVRAAPIDERTKVRISQTLKKNLQKQQATWGGTTSVKKQISGTASSVAFTPLQGLEIVNPNAAESRADEEAANAKYFSSSAAFMKVKTPAPNNS